MQKRILRIHIQAPVQVGEVGKLGVIFRLALRKEINMHRLSCLYVFHNLAQHPFKIVVAEVTHSKLGVMRVKHDVAPTHVDGDVEMLRRIHQAVVL